MSAHSSAQRNCKKIVVEKIFLEKTVVTMHLHTTTFMKANIATAKIVMMYFSQKKLLQRNFLEKNSCKSTNIQNAQIARPSKTCLLTQKPEKSASESKNTKRCTNFEQNEIGNKILDYAQKCTKT